MPVLGHLEGVCHTYVHASADPDMARRDRRQRQDAPGLGLRRDRDPADRPRRRACPAAAASPRRCARRAANCAATTRAARDRADGRRPSEADWTTEYLAPILAVRVVDGLDEAIDHIARYGSGHTEAIVAEDAAAAEALPRPASTARSCMWNASTQFADGGEFGFGAEIGIATGRLHARGPVGPEQLTTFKYVVRGTGQVAAMIETPRLHPPPRPDRGSAALPRDHERHAGDALLVDAAARDSGADPRMAAIDDRRARRGERRLCRRA